MAVTMVTAELTLAGRIPAMTPLIDRAEASLDEAQQTLDALAVSLSGGE
jgi:FMN-dependent NADH-azoreductase